MDIKRLQALSSSERSHFVHELNLEDLDSIAFLSLYQSLLKFAKEKKDWHMEWDLQFYYYQQRGNLSSTSNESIALMTLLEKNASQKDFKVGQITAKHFLVFEKYYGDQLSHGALYTHILGELEQMQEIGFEKFMNYYLVWMLYHNGRFMYQLGDNEKALQFFIPAERFIEQTEKGGHTYILVMNHLQTMYQKLGDFPKAIDYAKQIHLFTQNPPTEKPQELSFYRQWQGLSSCDIASMLVKQGKLVESEPYASQGYQLSKTNSSTNISNANLEYTALQVLIASKLELGDLPSATPLLARLEELYGIVGGDYENYFNNIESTPKTPQL